MEWKMASSGMAEASEHVIAQLMEKGHEAYWVGGCIRDELLGRPVHDMDITTSALPEEVISIFPRCVPTGLQHGTVTVLQAGYGFEVTTYRTESGYVDYRRPEQVFFVSDVNEDLRRRDFTINAICCGIDGLLIDPFGGAVDLERQVIRCVGDAEERFAEDALRMLRCVRFASALDFSVTKNTWRGLLRQRDKLVHIAVERVRAELERIVEGPHPRRGLGMLVRSGLLPRSKAPFPWTGSDLAAAAALSAGIGELQSARLRWALLLHALKRSAQEADELLRAWTFPGTTRTGVVLVLRVREAWTAALEQVPPGSVGGTEALRRCWIAAVLAYGREAAEGWLTLLAALPAAPESRSAALGPDSRASGTQALGIDSQALGIGTQALGIDSQALSIDSQALGADTQVTGIDSLVPGPTSTLASSSRQTLPVAARKWLTQMPLSNLAALAVTGNELVETLQKTPGPWLGILLQQLLQAVAAGDILNDKQLLLQEAKRMDGHEQL